MVYDELINSQSVQLHLEKVATSNEDKFIRGTAIKKLNNQNVLIKLALEDTDEFIRQEAARRIVDEGVLTVIATKDSSSEVRRSAISVLTHNPTLNKIVLNDNSDYVRETAVKQLDRTCQKLFAMIAVQDSNWTVRHAATWKMRGTTDNQDILYAIACNDSNEEVRKAAVIKLQNQDRLFHVVINDTSDKVRQCGILKLNDKQLLSKIAQESNFDKIREIAVSKIDDTCLLAKIAKGDNNRWIREQAVHNIAIDEVGLKTLTEVAVSDPDENVRYTAVKKIRIPEILKVIALKSMYTDSGKAAISNLDDIETLVVLRMTAKQELQTTIIEKIKELQKSSLSNSSIQNLER